MKETQNKMGKTRYQFSNRLKYEEKNRKKKRENGNLVNFQEVAGCKEKCPSYAICYIAGNFSQTAHAFIGYFEVT